VRAVAHDQLGEREAAGRGHVSELRGLAETLATAPGAGGDCERAYRTLQQRARAVLRAQTSANEAETEADVAVTWWCGVCGGLDAPEPCLGICIWREVEWVSRNAYERRRARVAGTLAAKQRLEAVARHLAWVTPRSGRWEDGWGVLRTEARAALRYSARSRGTMSSARNR
jgi:hypothetical protein